MTLKYKSVRRLLEYRPGYHLMPPVGSANDVQCIFWQGEYHIFYGYLEPLGTAKCWGHTSSRDLLHWRHHPPCLKGGTSKEKEKGTKATWTGCIVDNDGVPTAFYTGVYPQVQCMATSKDMICWEKYAENPVISSPPPELGDIPNFRDPCVWREKDGWYMAIGSGIPGKGSAVLLYHSMDLVHWKYLHPLFLGPIYDNEMYECPDFFQLGEKYVLLASTVISGHGKTLCFVGDYKKHRFVPETEEVVDQGPALYAAKTLLDGKGRRLLWGWIPEEWSRDFRFLAGWAGAYSIPRELLLSENNKLRFKPVKELSQLRGKHWGFDSMFIKKGEIHYLPGVKGHELEMQIEFFPGNALESGLMLCCSPKDSIISEYTRIFYKAQEGNLVVDRCHSSEFYEVNVKKDIQQFPVKLSAGGSLQIHLFLDNSIIEIYTGDSQCWTGRIYPFLHESRNVAVFSKGGDSKLGRMDIWKIESAECNFGGG